jgi:hypothetical protein
MCPSLSLCLSPTVAQAYCIRSWGGSSYRGTAMLTVQDVLKQAHDCNPVRLASGMDKFRKLNLRECAGCLGC